MIDNVQGPLQALEQHDRRERHDFQILKSELLTRKVTERPGIFREVLRDPRPLSPAEVDAWLNGFVEREQLSPSEVRELCWADLLVRGEREGQDSYLVTEVSWTVGPKDVERAQRRAGLLRRVGVPAWPLVVGRHVSDRARDHIRQQSILHIDLGPDDDELKPEGDS
jgi:hypothetical protein